MRRSIAPILIALGMASAVGAQSGLLAHINTPQVDYGAIETPHGVFVTRAEALWGEPGRSQIRVLRENADGAWTDEPVPFASAFSDSDPSFDAAGDRLCFASTRPRAGEDAPQERDDIWCSDRGGDAWGEAYRLPEPVNSDGLEYSPVFDAAGTLYFASDRPGGRGEGDLYSAAQDETGDWRIEALGDAINSATGEWNLVVSADGATVIFEASSRASNRTASGDLYMSRRDGAGWTPAIPLSRLNSDASDLMPRWMADGALVYTSARLGGGDAGHFSAAPEDYEPIAPALAVIARSSGHVVLLDPLTLEERARYHAGTGPHEIASSADGRIAVAPLLGVYPEPHDEPVSRRPRFLSRPSEGIAILDLARGTERTVSLENCDQPHGAAADAQARRVWVTCETDGRVIELDSGDWSVVRSFDTGRGVHKVIAHPTRPLVVAADPEQGAIHFLALDTGAVETLETGPGAEGITLSADGDTAWIANGGNATFCRVDVPARAIAWCEPTGGSFPIAVALVEARGEVWVSRLATSDIAIFSAEDGSLIEEITLDSGALNLAVNGRDGLVYASQPRLNAVIAIDAATREIAARAGGVMEGDDLDLIPANAFDSPPDP